MKTTKKIILLLLCFILIASLSVGCKKVVKPEDVGVNSKTESVKLFFPLKDNSKLGNETREITFKIDSDRLKTMIEELLKGPVDQSLSVAANPGTKLISASVTGNQAVLDFSKEFNSFSGTMDEAAKLASIVDTTLQINGLTEVKITVEGQDIIAPSGMPYGFMKYIDFNTVSTTEDRSVTLYFANGDADGVVAEKRVINVEKNISKEDFYKRLVQELIVGPAEKTLYKTIPPEAEILRFQLDGEIATVDFSKEMFTKHWRGTAGESMTLASIINTLTEYPEIKRVMLLIEGQPMNIDSVVVDEPLTRMDDMIKK